MNWSGYLRLLIGTFVGANLALYLFVLAMNPYGNLPNTVLPAHAMMDDNERYQYPSVVRSGRYDSLIIGTSTARLLDPRRFEAILGGRFANVGMSAGTAWEQERLTRLFMRRQSRPRALVVGLDYRWCATDADTDRITFRGFPEWMYDNDPWNDLLYMYNTRAVQIAGRRFGAAFSGRKPRLPAAGHDVWAPESTYDLKRALQKLYGGTRSPQPPKAPPDTASAEERAQWSFPALPWLEAMIAEGNWQRVLLVFPPVHLVAQPQLGSRLALMEAECKERVAHIGAVHNAPVIDFRIHSEITSNDSYFWDPLHYRVEIAERVANGIARALVTGRNDPEGDWHILKAAD